MSDYKRQSEMRDVIVSFSSKGREDYNRSLLRLIDSCIEHWKGDVLVYSPDHDLDQYRGVRIHKGWPQPKGVLSYTHAEMPYQFKTAMIQLAIEKGYERVIWLDSSMQLKKDLTPLFNERNIFFFHNLGHPTWNYLSDNAQSLLSISNEELRDIPQVWGGVFGLDLCTWIGKLMFGEMRDYSVNGSFKDGASKRQGFVAHRHDQAVMSVLLYRLTKTFNEVGLLLPYGQILCPPHDRTGEYGTDPYLVCRGL